MTVFWSVFVWESVVPSVEQCDKQLAFIHSLVYMLQEINVRVWKDAGFTATLGQICIFVCEFIYCIDLNSGLGIYVLPRPVDWVNKLLQR